MTTTAGTMPRDAGAELDRTARPAWLEAVQAWMRRPRDAVSVLTIFLVVSFAIPSPLIFKPLGGSGTPGDLIGLGLLLWWAAAKLGTRQGVDRGHQPVRVALLVLTVAVLCSIAAMFLRPFSGEESSSAYRGMVTLAALIGVALVTVFFGISVLVVGRAARVSPQAMMVAAMVTYVVKIVLLAVVVSSLNGATAFSTRTLGFVAIGCILVWSATQVITTVKLKMLYVEPERRGG